MASPGINFESIEALWAKALALDLEIDSVDLDASQKQRREEVLG